MANYVAVMTLPDSTLSPLFFGSTLPASARPVLSVLVDTFNLWLRDGLTGQPAKTIDQNALGKNLYANPVQYGLTNNPVPTWDAAKIQAITGGAATDGSSLFCNSTAGAPYDGLLTGADVNT